MSNDKTIIIYVRNKDISPSSYYRIVQYAKNFDGKVYIRDIAPKKLYQRHLNLIKNKNIKWLFNSIIYYFVMLIRAIYYLSIDYMKCPHYIIVSKCICPRYTPLLLRFLIKKMAKKAILYWDFDDYIFESGEISKSQAKILERYSQKIIVTNDFLRSKVNDKYRNKVILLPTTDGDMQGFKENELSQQRISKFDSQIKLVWVATSGNIPHLEKVIPVLDKSAMLLKKNINKKLILTVVCNKAASHKTKYLEIKNVKWTRERAKKEIYDSHIGIMPLIHMEYALGKGGFKLIQYISTGLPVIASKVGFNQEVVDKSCGIIVDDKEDNNGWIEAIFKLSSSLKDWKNYSENAYKHWKENFSYDYNLKVWKRLLGQ